ncbi:hypothetical protein [Roseivirga misakiensis]|uniref:SIR2-like domain-containing protein n=1 Tax=Roseivirga misakiensis TaxID=1563681 RepID=A0A1E5SZS0_9BACT|nr:hypothetical protein [Roseivirga misakiensis]OEK04628.1 hypothetical protein BFP71_14325 [Roseivirga misakiensis]
MSKSVSLLLGAGFSAPKGYPIGNELNEMILACDGTEFTFHTSGVLVGEITQNYRNHYEITFDFLRDLIKFYSENVKYFDYEEFYDYLVEKAYSDENIKAVGKKFLREDQEIDSLLNNAPSIYAQMVGFYLKDREGKIYHDNEEHAGKFTLTGYTGILNCLEIWGQTSIVHVHTLNHDLYFERLSVSDWIQGELSDGFQEIGSNYYGKLLHDDRSYLVKLSYYSEGYNTKYRLYKLHGSRDYGIYYTEASDGVLRPEVYLKTRYGVGFGEFYKELMDENGKPLKYEKCWVNYHADFLTGTTSKIERYQEPLLYNRLFDHFRKNLEESESLVIIGYGAKDEEINRMLIEHFDYEKKPAFIVDPYAGKAVEELAVTLGAKIIKTELDSLSIEEFT